MIVLKDITKTYLHNNQTLTVLDKFSHAFKEGSKTAILGESGSGKTTLLNLIGGIDLEYEGELLFDGESISDFDRFRRENVSFIFQDLNLIGHLSLIKNITLSLTNDVVYKEQKAIELLKHVGLYDHRDKKPHQLSGGERQRVAIARALARETDILLCDEPTGNLDDVTKIEIMDLIMNVFKDKTVIFVTHDEDIAFDYGDEVLKFDEDGIKHEVIKMTKHVESKKNKGHKKSFNKRFEFNLLSRKFSLFHSSYLIIIIAAIFLFGTGIIKGIETEVDKYYVDKYKVDKIDVHTYRFTYDGFSKFVDTFNGESDSQIIGFMTALSMYTSFEETDTQQQKYLLNIQPEVIPTLKEDLVVGKFPINRQEVLYSRASALHSLYHYYADTIENEEALKDAYDDLFELSDEEILTEVQKLEISYKNTYRHNPERFYDKPLTIVGLINDDNYYDNESIVMDHLSEETTLMVNRNIYMLEEEFLDYVYVVYLGHVSLKFGSFSVFIEEENFDLRNEVFDGFLLHGFQISGRDYITNERNDYHERLHGYKITLIAGCLILLIFGAISIYNGIQSNIERNKKNIGIYKSLGYTSKNIKVMFIKEGWMISLFTILLSGMVWFVVKTIMNGYIIDALDPTNRFGFDNVAYLSPLSLLLVVSIIVLIIMTSINQEFRKINIPKLIKHK